QYPVPRSQPPVWQSRFRCGDRVSGVAVSAPRPIGRALRTVGSIAAIAAPTERVLVGYDAHLDAAVGGKAVDQGLAALILAGRDRFDAAAAHDADQLLRHARGDQVVAHGVRALAGELEV